MIAIHQQFGAVQAYLSRPPDGQYRGAVLVLHEVWGLNEHMKHITDRVAEQGYLAMAPNLLSNTTMQKQLTAELENKLKDPSFRVRREVQPRYNSILAAMQSPQFASLMMGRVQASFRYLMAQAAFHQEVAVIGFGFGGNYAYRLAIHEQQLKLAVVFYGQAGRYIDQELGHIQCPILAFYGGKDVALSTQAGQLDSRMQMLRKKFNSKIYPEAYTGFFNDTNDLIYDIEAAKDSWAQTVEFLHLHMRGSGF